MGQRGVQKTTLEKPSTRKQRWWVVDASGKTLGRLATRLATVLMGKHKPGYTPHIDTGDYVIVTNAGKVRVTGRKLEKKEYKHYTGYMDGLKPEFDRWGQQPDSYVCNCGPTSARPNPLLAPAV